jgi:signal transduction histidine kinase
MSMRRRLIIALLVVACAGYVYLDWAQFNALSVLHVYRGGYPTCDGSWRTKLNSCVVYSPKLTVAELVIVTLLTAGLLVMLVRWVAGPVRDMTRLIAQFGPNSLGLRLEAAGKRDETNQLAAAINAMLDRVSEGYEAQRRFAGNASHELRTPLATQRALIEVSLRGSLSEEQLDLLARQLLATNERNEALIEGLLVLAEVERGAPRPNVQRLDEIVDDAIHTLAGEARGHDVRVEASLDPVEVVGERPLLERLAANLVHNAVKYNHTAGWVHVHVAKPGLLVVRNSGPVVPAERVDLLFEPFLRANGDRLDHGRGVGLGLTIARTIVAAHGGSIAATANPDGGLTVEVHLPASRRAAPITADPARRPSR